MRKPSPQFLSRVQVRAYYLAEASGFTACPVACWLAAEAKEKALVAKKTASAKASRERKALGDSVVRKGRTVLVIESPAPPREVLH